MLKNVRTVQCSGGTKKPSDVFSVAKNVNKLYGFGITETFHRSQDQQGASGSFTAGLWKQVVAIKVNNPAAVKLQADADEVRMQSRLFCHVRDHAAEFRGSARIPETFFSVRIPRIGRALAMEQMDKSLLAYVQDLKSPVLQIRCLRSALDRVAKL